MKHLKDLQNFFNQTARKAKYVFTALMTALLIISILQLSPKTLANQTSPQKATFDPSQMSDGKVEISTKAFGGTVRVYPNGGKQEKTPQEYPVLKSSSTGRDQLWVAGGSESWAHFQFWGKEVHQKPRVDPLVQAGINQAPTRYTFPCKINGTGVIGWGLTKVGGGACEHIVLGSSRYIKGDAGSFVAEKSKAKVVPEKEKIAQDVSDSDQLTISRSQDLTLVYVYDLEGDIGVDVLVGSVQIGSFGSVNAGTRYLNSTKATQPINPSEISKSPSVQKFLDKESWSRELASLIDRFDSAISPLSLTQEQQEILDAHNQLRSQVNVPPLRWSKNLADYAQEWADNPAAQGGPIKLQHSPRNRSGGSGAGENMAGGSTVTEMVNDWGSEVKDYNYATNSCRPGEVCGHYTQVVWRDSTDLGCGVAPHRSYGKLLVCNYSPPGNYGGERPY